MRNIRLDIAYDGTRYRGWQRLTGDSQTIQGKIELTLSRILQEDIKISGSGRTDSGAHALHQIANFHCNSEMCTTELLSKLRQFLPEDIGIHSCEEVSPRFHARLNAKDKTYCYRIWNSLDPCVFERRYVYVFPDSLDIEKMRQSACYLLGEHDFSAFCTKSGKDKSTVRRIDSIEIKRENQEIQVFIRGNGFLYNMVRIIVGTLIEVGLGKRSPDSVLLLFGNKRKEAGELIPARGLCLMEVTY